MALFQFQGLSPDSCLLLLALLCAFQPRFSAFNLDVDNSVVKEGGTAGSLFGLSVAFHKQTEGTNRYLLLVGAPKEKAEPHLSANETGDVYACPISTEPSDCTRMNLLSSGTDKPDPNNDIVDGMWLGVSVASQPLPGGRVMACGHRYVRIMDNGANWRMIGRCYIRSNNLTYDGEDDYQWQDNYEVCVPLNSYEMEGMCNMGMSAAITETEVIVGSPGSFEWQGNVHVIWRNPNDQYDTMKTSFPNLQTRNIYMGYSVAKARGLLSQQEDTVVTGAPRDKSRGSVILAVRAFAKDGQRELAGKLTLYGEQVGSYFGNSIAVADLNNDGWKDLIVGAPFYFDRKKDEGGAVYVFMNENGSFRNKSNVVLRGPMDSAFGMAVTAIGDVNQDGFQDFAVGAPFYGTGQVSIWTGSRDGISQKPSQVIKGKDIRSGGFRTFGYSIGGGMDVDDNKYPDIVVGSLDNRVALLRARPVIHLMKSFSVTPQIVDPIECNSCVEVKVCFSYTISTGDASFKNNITVKYTVEADVLQRNSRVRSRVRFLSSGQDSYTGYVSMPSASCQTQKLDVVKPVRDKVKPLAFSLNVSLHEGESEAHQAPQNLDNASLPVMSEGNVLTEEAEIHFQKACGTDNKCNSNLQMSATFEDENEKPFPSVDGRQVFQYNTGVKRLMLVVEVTNIPSPGIQAEDAHNGMLNATIPPSLRYSGIRSENKAIVCSAEDLILLCELGNPFASNETEQIKIIFETSGINLDTREIQTKLQLSTLSEQSDLQPLAMALTVEYALQTSFVIVQHGAQTFFSGAVMGESAMKSTKDIGSPVEFTYIVDVIGNPLGSLGTLEVVFDWPLEVVNGKWLLYLSEIQTTGTSNPFCVPPEDVVNPLNLTVSERTSARRKRESSVEGDHEDPQPSMTRQGPRKTSVLLSCATGGARCKRFSCPLRGMNNSATVIVRARLWNSTMLEDFTDAWRITVNGLATLRLETDNVNNETREFTLDIEPEVGEEAPYEAPLWIIIVSVLAGVLLLSLIVILLWRCGFFKRASTRELYEAKAQKAEMKTQPSENDRLTEEL